ncbi:MAG TPA: thioredoxin domain-containing protein, partial [Spirochaeta sp.]|nr:thioredoxin domain-containing protein [Spirochaeta sp.]
FPQPQNILLLLRMHKESGDSEALEMAENTLRQMRAGGIWDHLGYGFHRYSTDREWLLPHFEKMLYDQAMLILAYTEAYQLTKKQEYRQTAEDVIEYVLRDMRSPEGGFYSAEDADSEGKEGKFYLWDMDEFTELLTDNGFDAGRYADYFSLQPRGNFADEATKMRTGENILHTQSGLPLLSEDENNELEAVRSLLFTEREKRIHPYKDDKVLTDWNGLMIFALARASWSFGRPEYLKAAEASASLIINEMKQADGSMLHSRRSGVSKTMGMIDDYAFFIRGLLELYRADFNTEYLEQAAELTAYSRDHFEDDVYGGFFQSNIRQTDLLVRKKTALDNALPSGSSVMFENLLQLFKITGETSYRDAADGILNSLTSELEAYPSAFGMLLSSVGYMGEKGREIVVVGEAADTEAIIAELNSRFMPDTVVLHKTEQSSSALKALAPYTEYYNLPAGKRVVVYVCTNFSCSRPVFTVNELAELLGE